MPFAPATFFLITSIAFLRARSFSFSGDAIFFAAILRPRIILDFAFLKDIALFLRAATLRTASNIKSSPSSCSISSAIFIPSLTAWYTLLAELCSFLGRPDLNAFSSPLAAAARILDADMPSAPSASGSRSPADTTSIESNV